MINFYLITATAKAIHRDRLEEAARDRLVQQLPAQRPGLWQGLVARLWKFSGSLQQKQKPQVEVNHPVLQ